MKKHRKPEVRKIKTEVLQIGEVGVDSGQLFIGDPCYLKEVSMDDLYTECSKVTLSKQRGGVISLTDGVAVSTGFGDGVYPVFAEICNGRVVKVWIEFIT